MVNECCGSCCWWEEACGVCCNVESENLADFTCEDDGCEAWEENG